MALNIMKLVTLGTSLKNQRLKQIGRETKNSVSRPICLLLFYAESPFS